MKQSLQRIHPHIARALLRPALLYPRLQLQRRFSVSSEQQLRIESLTAQFNPRTKSVAQAFCKSYADAPAGEQALVLREVLATPGTGEMLFRNVLEHELEGVHFLVALRRDLLRWYKLRKKEGEDVVELREGVKALSDIMRPLFGQASLDLRRISLESQGALIEKLMAYEQVHPYMGLGDVKRRLGYGYRCFALFHPKLSGEPLIFVHVALVSEIADSMDYIRESRIDEHEARAAIFYTISASEQGLAGFDLGNQLINRVVVSLQREFPQLQLFSTLSPVPLFTKWLSSVEAEDLVLTLDAPSRTLLERKHLEHLEITGNNEGLSDLQVVLAVLEGHPQWYRDSELNEALERPLTSLMTRYLSSTRAHRQLPLCPVASFHLQNGAILRRINWNADLSRKGLDNSAGMMVNYQYVLGELQQNMDAIAHGSLAHALRPYV